MIYHVAVGGDDAGRGTRGQPWKSLARASGAAGPGDTVLFEPGVYHGVLRPEKSGREGAPVVFKSSEPRAARLAHYICHVGGDDDSCAVDLSGISHVRVEGFYVKPHTGRGRWMLIRNSSHIDIDDCLMEDSWSSLPLLVDSCQQVRIRDNVIRQLHAEWGGDMFRLSNSQHILVEGNAVSRAGHSPFGSLTPTGDGRYGSSRRITVRGNVFHAGWGRALEIFRDRDVLFEHNIIVNSVDGGRSADSMAKFLAERAVFRYNRVFRNWGAALSMIPYREFNLSSARIYNNVVDGNMGAGLRVKAGGPMLEDVILANNIFSNNDPFGENSQISMAGEPSRGIFFLNNCITGREPGLAVIDWDGEHLSVPEAEGPAGRGVFAGNFDENPGFISSGGGDHRIRTESPLKDRGIFLCHARADGAGKVVPVDDASYFYDGFGIRGESGDVISVGDPGRRATVLTVDRRQNKLTLDRNLEWQSGEPVWLGWEGNAPDVGAFENGGGRRYVCVAVPPPGDDSSTTRPGETVTLKALTGRAERAVEFLWDLGDGSVSSSSEVSHAYERCGDYPVRVKAIFPDGTVCRGTGLVVVENPGKPGEPLIHSTFDAEDSAWWRQWQAYRPAPARAIRRFDEATGHGFLKVAAAEEGNGLMPGRIHPPAWDLDMYPVVEIEYSLSPGTPVCVYAVAFDSAGPRRARLAAAGALPPAAGEEKVELEKALIDDGHWHRIELDARLIRHIYPEVNVLRGLYFEAPEPSLIRLGHEYCLNEVIIRPPTVAAEKPKGGVQR